VGRETNKSRREASAASARDKAAAARALQAQADRRRRAIVILSSVVAAAVVIVVVALIAINSGGKNNTIANNRAVAPASVMDAVTHVPVATLNKVGQGTIVGAPQPISGGTALTAGGKPQLLYVGAEFCPYCAAERWSMGVALSRFGTLSGVRLTQSAANDTDPNTATLDYIGSKYASKYLAFNPIEAQDRNHKDLEKVSPTQAALWTHYAGAESFPFLDFANKYVVKSPTFDPALLKGLTQQQIASKLADPNDSVAKGVDGAANLLTASICGMTNNQPANVCTSPTITGIKAKVDAQKSVS
jgi:Domain of unknown function (DUF929)